MTLRISHKFTAWSLLTLIALGALTVQRPAGGANDEPGRTSRESSPFLEAFLSTHNVRVESRSVQWISAAGEHHGLLVRDDSNEQQPALLLIDRSLASEFAKLSAHELAGIGYVVLLLELDLGRTADSRDGRKSESENSQRERALAQLTSAVRWLRRRDDVSPDRIGVLGFRAAARWALEAAAAGGLQAAVLVDPPLPFAVDAELGAGLRQTSVLIVRGAADDSLLDGEHLARLKRELGAAGVAHHVLAFDKEKAGFMQRGQPDTPDAEPADRAWFEIYEYLGKHVEDVALKRLLATPDNPDEQPAQHPHSSIADLMRALNGRSSVWEALAKSLANAPQSEKDWQGARSRAALLADAGEMLLELKPAKGEAAAWRRHAAAFRDSASAITVAADRRDYTAARQALDRLNMSCGKCHLDHR